MPLFLTDDQISRFESDGVLVVPDVLPPQVLKGIEAEYGALLDTFYAAWQAEGRVPDATGKDFYDRLRIAYEAGCDWFQPMDISLPGDEIRPDTPFHIGPAVFEMLTCAPLLDLVEDLIGPEITSNPIQHVRLKPPARTLRASERTVHLMATDWHQDRAVAHEEGDATQMVTVWLAISDADEHNGCLQAIPGRRQMYPHCPKRQTCIADGFIDEADATPLPVKAGGAVIFHPLTPHAAYDNVSDRFRWSFDIRFNVTGQPTGRAHFPEFVARSRAAPDRVLRDWRICDGMWRDARARIAGQPHIPLHRWQGDSPACA